MLLELDEGDTKMPTERQLMEQEDEMKDRTGASFNKIKKSQKTCQRQ